MFGLLGRDLEELNAIFKSYPAIERVVVFGSRAMENYKNGSDVDLSFYGQAIDNDILSEVNYQLNEESMMPYQFDTLNYATIRNIDLKDHINRVGKEIYSKF